MILKEIIQVVVNPSDPEDWKWIDKLQHAEHWSVVGKGTGTTSRTYEKVGIVFNADEVLALYLSEGDNDR